MIYGIMNSLLESKKIVLYGLSTETERILNEWDGKYNVLGLLDGFKNSGEQFGYPIMDINDVVKIEDVIIIVVARPGSCKVIAKRIGDLCRENNVPLFDIRGKNLLIDSKVVYDFTSVSGYTKQELLDAIKQSKVISFDLFDTLLVRNISSFDGLVTLVDTRLKEQKINIPDFKNKRIQAEKTLSVGKTPTLTEIYTDILKNEENVSATADTLAYIEFGIDKSIIEARTEMVELCNSLVKDGKQIYITSDSYYKEEWIQEIMQFIGVCEVTGVLISCNYGTGKTTGLFDELIKLSGTSDILHIGDDIVADIESAKRCGIKVFQVYSASELLEMVGGLKLENADMSLSDKIRIGMFIANIFNSPFQFEDEAKRIHTDSARDIGYLFCAPMIMDFVKWFEEESQKLGVGNKWLCARDGYLIHKLYKIMYSEQKTYYIYTSRISAIRAGMETISDVEYVDSMKFGGECEDNIRIRFGIDAAAIDKNMIDEEASGLMKYSKTIIETAKTKKENNLRYIEGMDVQDGEISFFDFVAKGTSQMYIQKLVDNPIIGLYFLQLEPEFMKDKNLDIKPFYTEDERSTSAIFDNYYILETILTSPEGSVDEFDENGNPVFAKETRSEKDIACFMSAQEGISSYVTKYIRICPDSEFQINKRLDEVFLTLVHNVEIRDTAFLNLTIEDPFFNRMTDITDVL